MGKVLDSVGCNFLGSFEKGVRNGRSTKFWKDRWVGGEVLKERFARLYNLETCKEALVADRGSFVGKVWVWKWSWRRPPLGREDSGFSVKVLRTVLDEKRSGMREVGSRGDPTSWVKAIPSKINVFYWRANLARLPCRESLDKCGIDLDSTLCLRCNREVETVSHALFSCEKVNALWLLMGRWWNLDVSST
ncbi:hypothetical protein OSB04_002313 [Centaurea solstitialis]|uniref:Reverse transcriptase zinc-binding domain-containing protein n=1 Tax=Centaurea solstitialis TaxID=347529 RepID=A0AA38WMN2_9ASTR|nr:hypothetical protein OSB04_002313 [Centaurea solstitialis]